MPVCSACYVDAPHPPLGGGTWAGADASGDWPLPADLGCDDSFLAYCNRAGARYCKKLCRGRGIVGCALILTGMLLLQLSIAKHSRKFRLNRLRRPVMVHDNEF